MDNHGVGIGDIQPGFNDRCGYQHVDFPVDKVSHNPFEFPFAHLPVGEGDDGIRDKGLNPSGDIVNIIYPVVHIVNLSVSCKLAVDGFPDHLFIIFHNIGLDGKTVNGRLFQNTHIPDTDQAHVQSTGNRRGG